MSAVIELMKYYRRVNQIVLFCETTNQMVADASFKDNFARVHVRNAREEIKNIFQACIRADVPEHERPHALTKFLEDYERHIRIEADNYFTIVLNHHLVMVCTYFELFLCDILENILKSEPKILIGLVPDRKVELRELIETGSVQAILNSIIDEYIKQYSHYSYTKMIEKHAHIGLDTFKYFDNSQVTDLRYPDIKEYGQEKLGEIQDTRNKIVHDGLLPISNFHEFDRVCEFIMRLIINICRIVSEKFNIPLTILDNPNS